MTGVQTCALPIYQAIAYEGQTYSPSTGGVSGTPVSGNPISYFNGTRWAMDWAEGRNLVEAETATDTANTGLSFAYDAGGMRTGKTVTIHTHAYAAAVVQPTCTEGGYTVHTCACGDSYQDSETDPLGHNYVESEVDTYTCTRCGDSYTTHTHSYTTTVVEPTCTEDGYTLYQCVSCGYSYEDFVVDALGHDFERISMTPDEATYECTRCGYIYTEESIPIPTLPDPPVVQYGEGEEPAEASAASQQALVPTVTEEHSYIYAGGMLLRETITSGNSTETLDFRYDNLGYPYALIYNNGSTTATYYYITNLQGDVMYLVDSNGSQAAAYTYDPYGKILSATGAMAEINPLRYRGYYYDSETGFYYLQSRYYDPNTCRFINADSYASTGQGLMGYNMFAYCNNNPIINADPTGHSVILTGIIVGAVIGTVVGGYAGAKISEAKTGEVNGWAVAGGAVAGGIVGGLIGWGVGTAISTFGTTAVGAATAPAAGQIAEKASTAIQTYYPPNNGFSGTVEQVTLEVGTILQRTGDLAGRFVAPAGTPIQMLSLPYDKAGQTTILLEVTQPIQALCGRVAPWFGQIGGGIQYLLLDGRVDQLILEEIIKSVGG